MSPAFKAKGQKSDGGQCNIVGAEKHRLYAMELGVNAYLGKPYQEVELLEHVKFYSEEELHNHANFHRVEGLLHQIASLISTETEG